MKFRQVALRGLRDLICSDDDREVKVLCALLRKVALCVTHPLLFGFMQSKH